MSEQRHTIHIRIRDLRRERALTQEELAVALGISRQSINAMEAGRCLPSLPVAMQIASFFSVPLHAVFEMSGLELAQLASSQQPNSQEEDKMPGLIPWSPLREMREALDELMDESAAWQGLPQVTAPAVNVIQTARDIKIEANLPGYNKDDVSIEVGEDFLTLAGKSQLEEEQGEHQYFRREFAQRSFQRTISLPALVQPDKAEAEMKHGVLTVTVPKVAEEKPKVSHVSIRSTE